MHEELKIPAQTPGEAYERLLAVVRVLRRECPWDRKQDHRSLRVCMIEEAYEVAEAIDHHTAADEGALALPDVHQALLLQLEHGRADGAQADAEALGQLGMGADASVVAVLPGDDLPPKLVGDLCIQRSHKCFVDHVVYRHCQIW